MKYRLPVIILLTCLSIIACRHRLKPKMYQINEGREVLMTTNESYYYKNLHLLLDSATMIPGENIVLVASHTLDDTGRTYITGNVISFDEKNTYRLYVELPAQLQRDSLDIAGKSVCRLAGKYDLANEMRTYICRKGFALIDSVRTKWFYAALSGFYVNAVNDTLQFRGDLKVRLQK